VTLPPSPRESAGYVPWWLLGLVAALFAIAAAALTGFVVLTRPADLPGPTVTAVVLTAPPSGSVATATLPAPPTAPGVEPTSTIPPPPSGEVRVGAYVQVTGTGDAGFLNLRAEPSLNSPVNYLAIEREVLQVQAGPTEASGFVWWYLVDPATNTKYGWAVQNYLQVVQGP
jgi:hypothetical protein